MSLTIIDGHSFEPKHDSQLGVPGAFTGTCNAQIPGYIRTYDDFKAKGIKNIYVISVNDVFVAKWVLCLVPSAYIHLLFSERGKTIWHQTAQVSFMVCKLITSIFKYLSDIQFLADDKGAFTSTLGLLYDATPHLGGPRSKVRVVYAPRLLNTDPHYV